MHTFIFAPEGLYALGTSHTAAIRNAKRTAPVEAPFDPVSPGWTFSCATRGAYLEAKRQTNGSIGRAEYDATWGGYVLPRTR
jgi:hypothetical protein